jgi:hypothetical protein
MSHLLSDGKKISEIGLVELCAAYFLGSHRSISCVFHSVYSLLIPCFEGKPARPDGLLKACSEAIAPLAEALADSGSRNSSSKAVYERMARNSIEELTDKTIYASISANPYAIFKRLA